MTDRDARRRQSWLWTATWLLAAAVLPCRAQMTAEAPDIRVGDTWTYQHTQERLPNDWRQVRDELAVTRVTGSTLFLSVRPVGSTQAPREMLAGKDWSQSRSFEGVETVVLRPLAFPLAPGGTWALKFTQPNPKPAVKALTMDLRYAVADRPEPVTVPAGTYQAIRIEAEGRWVEELNPTQTTSQVTQNTPEGSTTVSGTRAATATTRSGRLYQLWWYVPELKRWAKSVEEFYTPDGTRGERRSQELVSFRPGE